MVGVVLRRLGSVGLLLFLSSMIVFGLIAFVPGDPAVTLAGENATDERIAEVRDQLGLEDPFVEQYADWVSNALRGDLGSSIYNSSRDVTTAIAERLPATLSLAGGALVVAVLIGVPAGILSGLRQGSFLDRIVTLGATIGVAFPNYWLGMLLLLPFALWNDFLPATGYVAFKEDPVLWLQHLVLPCITLGVAPAAEIARQLRSSMHQVLQLDYVRTARAKGMSEVTTVGKHALKNAAIPTVTVTGIQVARLLGGTIIVEQVFGIPGLGNLAVSAVLQRDLPILQGIVLLSVVLIVTTNLLVDLCYSWLNPKVRL